MENSIIIKEFIRFWSKCSREIYFLLLKKNFLKQALKNSVKATVDSLRLPTIKQMPIELPSVLEQIKISNLFSYMEFHQEKSEDIFASRYWSKVSFHFSNRNVWISKMMKIQLIVVQINKILLTIMTRGMVFANTEKPVSLEGRTVLSDADFEKRLKIH